MDKAQVYIINLDRDTERWKKWNDVTLGFKKDNVHRFSAVDGKKMTDDEMKNYTTPLTYLKIKGKVKRSPEDMDNKGALCCSLSHFGVYNDFLKNYPDSKYLVVFEDDTSLSEGDKTQFYDKLSNALKKLPDNSSASGSDNNNWDMWLIGYSLLRDSSDWDNPDPTPLASRLLNNPTNLTNSNAKYRDVRSFWGSNAYVIKRDSIPKIQKYSFPIETHIDLFFSILAQHGYIRIINDKELILPQDSFIGSIPHTYFTIALLNQRDVIYKVLVFLFIILLLVLFYMYVIKGCFGYNFFNFLGNNLSCKL